MKSVAAAQFRCQVGHGYTAERLLSEQEGSVDEAMRVALRIVEERAVLTQKMAEEARRAECVSPLLPMSAPPLKAAGMSRHCAKP